MPSLHPQSHLLVILWTQLPTPQPHAVGSACVCLKLLLNVEGVTEPWKTPNPQVKQAFTKEIKWM